MNSLRRIATLPGLRAVLLRPGVRRRVASVLALRFQVAALSTTTPGRVVAGEVFSRGRIRTYRVRHTGVPVALQHGRDMEALFELFVRGEYEPPSPLGTVSRLTRCERSSTSGPTSGCSRRGRAGAGRGRASSRWSRPRRTSSCCTSRPAWTAGPKSSRPRSGRPTVRWDSSRDGVAVAHVPTEQEVATTVVRTVDWFPLFAEADFVKMDIEGGEWPILGDPRLRDLERLTLVMEYHRVGAPSLPAGAAARGLLEDAGFEVGLRHSQLLGPRHALGLEGLTPVRRHRYPVGTVGSTVLTRGAGAARGPRGVAGGRARAGGVTRRRRPRRRSTADRHTCRARAPTAWRRPVGGTWRASRAGGRARPRAPRRPPSTPTAPRARAARERRTVRDPGEQHPRPRHVREAPTALERQRHRRQRDRPRRPTPATTSSVTRSGAEPMNASVTCHWCGRATSAARAGIPSHVEEVVEVLDRRRRGLEGHEQPHGPIIRRAPQMSGGPTCESLG